MSSEFSIESRDVFVSLAGVLLGLLLGSMVCQLLLSLVYGGDIPDIAWVLGGMTVNPIVFGGCALFFAKLMTPSSSKALGFLKAKHWWLVLGVLLAGLVSQAMFFWVQSQAGSMDTGSIEKITQASQSPGLAGVGVVFAIVVLAPVAEELFFRGWLFHGVQEVWGTTTAVVATALAFALVHADPAHVFAILPLALWLSWMRAVSGSIWPCVVAHFINNTLWVFSVRGGTEPSSVPLWAVLASVLLLAGMVTIIARKERRSAM